MLIVLEPRRTAQILPFAVPLSRINRLTTLDRLQALDWNVATAAQAGAHLVIHDRQHDDAPEVSDYIGIYRADDRWAVWGLAREGREVELFTCLPVGPLPDGMRVERHEYGWLRDVAAFRLDASAVPGAGRDHRGPG